MHFKARHVLCYLFSTNHENGSEMAFMAGATRINLKNLKKLLWLDDLMQATIWRHRLYSDGRPEPLTNSDWSFTLPYKLETLKSSL